MSGFIDNLIARAQGGAQAILPIVPSLFERPAGIAGIEAIETVDASPGSKPIAETRDTAPENPEPVRPIHRAEPEPRVNVRRDAEYQPVTAPEPRHPIETRLVVAQPEPAIRRDREDAPPVIATSPSPDHVIREVSVPRPFPLPVETRLVREHEREVVTRERLLVPVDRDIPQPAIAPRETPAVAPLQPRAQPSSLRRDQPAPVPYNTTTSMPDIHVTIGRVEIRAAVPNTPVARRAAKPAMSLDEYLSQRLREDSR